MSEPVAIVISLLGGLAVFLLGLDTLTGALKNQTGEGLRSLIGRLTTNRFAGIATGTAATVLLQSSTITTVIAVGLVGGGMLTFTQSLGVVLGANIGTTFTAQLVAFSTSVLGLSMLFAGFILSKLSRRTGPALAGTVLLGLGLVFLGMEVMSDAVRPLRSYEPFLAAMESLAGAPLLGILAGALFTALVQSSTATTGVAIAMASEGLIPLEAGIAIIVGSNIGTCVTALLAAIGKPPAAVRTALFHVIVNVGGAFIWFFFLDQLADIARALAPSYPELAGLEQRAAETPRQFAMAHTVFNLSTALILVWFLGPIGRWLERMVPDQAPQEAAGHHTSLDDALLVTPAAALQATREEVATLAHEVQGIVDQSLTAALADSEEPTQRLQDLEEVVDQRYVGIVGFIRSLLATQPGTTQTRDAVTLLEQAGELERIADQISLTVLPIGSERRRNSVAVTGANHDLLELAHSAASIHLAEVLAASAPQDAVDQEQVFPEAIRQLRAQLLEADHDPYSYAVTEDLIGQFAAIHGSANRIREIQLATVEH